MAKLICFLLSFFFVQFCKRWQQLFSDCMSSFHCRCFGPGLRLFIASVVVSAEVQGRKWWCRCHWLLYPFFGARALATPVPFWWHISWNIFVDFFLSVALGLVLPLPWPWSRLVCLGPGLAVFLVLLNFGLGCVLVSLEAFWTTPLRQVEPNWNSMSFRIREREWYQ